MQLRWMVALLAVVSIFCAYLLWTDYNEREYIVPQQVSYPESDTKTETHKEVPPTNTMEKPVISTATIGMVGDVLLHNPIYKYPSFDFAFEAVKDKMESIDFLLANQESMPGGVELGLDTYPKFNSPKHIIRDLQTAGVDMLSFANNHTFDKGEVGVRNSIKHAQEYGMPYIGAYESFKDRKTHRVVDVNGIKVGILAYTYGTNVSLDLFDKEYLVNYIDRDRILMEMAQIKPLADIVIVSLHWGPEYVLEASEEQQELAKFVANAGADVIFGHHTHVLQRYDEIGDTKVFYSLGNFYSGQPFEYTNFGGIARLTVTKEQTGDEVKVTVNDPRFFPTGVVKDQQKRFTVVPLKDARTVPYSEEWVEEHVGVPKW
ncbi:CapA family protein [Sporosarcina sp. PTS2304]|uniref:CapA family protein n=1 Tax=Sporosarcina sp. PTS2304 TaxID=2283194 RepID=UPI000E0CD512|nr:CapA family protein [Sporosarcina sp. PTS2304]AXH99765.1 CapA family protein [Sporosarcina sp. PTS2304]